MQKPKRGWLQNFVRARRILTPCLPDPPPPSKTRSGESGRVLILAYAPHRSGFASVAPLQSAAIANLGWPVEHCANEPVGFLVRDGVAEAVSRAISTFAVFLVLLLVPSVYSAVTQVTAVGLTVKNLDREVNFFTNVLHFVELSRSAATGPEVAALFGLPDAKIQTATLKLGEEQIVLTEHAAGGRPIPADSRSNDQWFQHIAIVVSDMDLAFASLRQNKIKFVSTAPQELPAWNKNAGGIKAFYFRDPEDHVLEIIYFPAGKGDPKWQQPTSALFLGIDHTAIVVTDTDSSLAFYRGALGMRVAGTSENFGVEQEHLNQLFGARLRITALRADKGPGIEFLEYITPPGGRPLPADAKSTDLIFWRTYLQADRQEGLLPMLQGKKTLVSTLTAVEPGKVQRFIARDPDGHALEFTREMKNDTAANK